MFVPLYDDVPLKHVKRPWVTYTIIAANIIIFLLQITFNPIAEQEILASLGFIPAHFGTATSTTVTQIAFSNEGFTFVTYAFLHNDIWHLAGNMAMLWVFGDNVEDDMGHLGFLITYLLCAIAGGIAFFITYPFENVVVIGASGAVSGIIAAYVILYPKVWVWVLVLLRFPVRLPAALIIGAWIALQFYNFLMGSDGAVAWSAHVGGIIAGAILILLFRRRRRPTEY